MNLQLPPDAIGDHPNCGLIAMAVAANVNLSEASEAYQKACKEILGRRMQGNWKGRTYDSIRNYALVHYLGVSLYESPVRGGMSLKHLVHCINLNDNPTTYIITTTGHVQVVNRHTVVDQGGPCHINDYWGRRKKVKEVLFVDHKENKQ